MEIISKSSSSDELPSTFGSFSSAPLTPVVKPDYGAMVTPARPKAFEDISNVASDANGVESLLPIKSFSLSTPGKILGSQSKTTQRLSPYPTPQYPFAIHKLPSSPFPYFPTTPASKASQSEPETSRVQPIRSLFSPQEFRSGSVKVPDGELPFEEFSGYTGDDSQTTREIAVIDCNIWSGPQRRMRPRLSTVGVTPVAPSLFGGSEDLRRRVGEEWGWTEKEIAMGAEDERTDKCPELKAFYERWVSETSMQTLAGAPGISFPDTSVIDLFGGDMIMLGVRSARSNCRDVP